MKIEGYAALSPGKILEPFAYTAKELGPFEILIQITHCGLCHTDLYMMENSWKRSTYPLLPGHEIVGRVIKKGSCATKELNDRVGVGWIHSTCMNCPECNQGDTNICQHKSSIYNQGKFGGFANFVVADSRFAYVLPDVLNSAHAAPLLCAGATVYAALKKQTRKGDTGIIGIGGLGHLAIQFAKAMGSNVSAISSSPSKEEDAKQLGASHFYTYQNPPKANSFDFLLCTVTHPLNWNQILSFLRPNGVLCFVSRPLEGIYIDPMYLVSTQKMICGSNNANTKEITEMFSLAAKENIRPWIEQMPLSEIHRAIEHLRHNKARYRIVLSI
jgi:uncharacterized zinc-type alcohol dehydrogenase-like protein